MRRNWRRDDKRDAICRCQSPITDSSHQHLILFKHFFLPGFLVPFKLSLLDVDDTADVLVGSLAAVAAATLLSVEALSAEFATD